MPPRSFTPSRLLDIGVEGDLEWKMCLNPGDVSEHPEYMTLSCRWGLEADADTILVTTNIDYFRQGQPIEMFPQSFRNAIIVARRFGIRYLWIDSLCIIRVRHMTVYSSPPGCTKWGRNSLTFFSDSRLLSLSTRLKNNKVNEVVGRISGIVIATGRRPQEPAYVVDPAKAVLYIQLYFERVHPVFALLDKASFETTVFSPSFPSFLVKSKPWLCLYHSVLALGCQYANGGTFEPGKGESWLLFSVALRAFSDLLLTPDSLTLLQALTVMSVYGLGLCGLAVEPVIMSEAVRRAQMMSHNTFTGSAATAYRKAFWTLYSVEKISSFHFGRSSGFVDSDIHCPIPIVPEAIVGEFNWFLPLICFARLLSRAYASLFSVGVSGNSNSYFLDVVSQLNVELETWRLSLPDNGFRPGGFIRPHAVPSTVGRNLALIVHYLYNSMLLTLSRTTLVYLQTDEDAAVAEQKAGCMRKILDASRSILELTTMIEVEPYTATWVIAGIPLTALFVLFDIVIHDPRHPETASNLALLDMAAGHFSRIEYASGGSLPGSLIAEFAKIARDYVNETQPSLPIPGTVGLPLEAAPSAVVVPEVNVGDGQDDKQALIANIDPPQTISMPTVPSSFAEFALDSAWDQFSPGMVMGTDVMGLFNYFLPDLDPMFYPGPMGEYDFSQDPTGNMTL
ncbi:putative transcriptional regulatory protein [Colletotrichum spinosum]|uniref:Putative transcriptional regulatory protein n=1 Tax=Colletotrichum spinosum TaxID=1347390 RepID=A0A4R8PSP9_9PEZI|nr:putative transcriptional regulatory protein [Colletotrichum spinosum]